MNICRILSIYRFKMVHTFEQHKNKLDELCRLCGNKSLTRVEKKKNRKKLLCVDYTADILLVFNIFVQRDSESEHPKHLCYKCMKTLGSFKKTLTNAQTNTKIERKRNERDRERGTKIGRDRQMDRQA